MKKKPRSSPYDDDDDVDGFVNMTTMDYPLWTTVILSRVFIHLRNLCLLRAIQSKCWIGPRRPLQGRHAKWSLSGRG